MIGASFAAVQETGQASHPSASVVPLIGKSGLARRSLARCSGQKKRVRVARDQLLL